ncbi:MAG: SDR family oxidoreductase [Thermoleophilaceae bacterium]|nr:SDR family oxidoreductase [Thermoleophilaceae bacterium]
MSGPVTRGGPPATIVVTGASSGIGRAAAVELAGRGALVTPVGRDPRRLDAAAQRIRSAAGGLTGESIVADFARLDDVRRLATELLDRHERIDVLVNNAGLVADRRRLTGDGNELTFQVNHLAPFLLTNLLLDRLRASAPARVVTTSSDAHHGGRIDFDDLTGERSWSALRAYSSSKLANVLFTHALARRLDGSGVTANCLHPGVVRTRLATRANPVVALGWTLAKPFFRSPQGGAATAVHLATHSDGAEFSGAYFADSRVKAPRLDAVDDELAERLWRASEELVGLERA